MRFFPPRKKLLQWLSSGKLTGKKPRRLKRQKDEAGVGIGDWFEVLEHDWGEDDEDWEYVDVPLGAKESWRPKPEKRAPVRELFCGLIDGSTAKRFNDRAHERARKKRAEIKSAESIARGRGWKEGTKCGNRG